MVKPTGTVWGVLVAPGAEMVMVALYVPALRPDMSTDTVTLSSSPVDEPLIGLKDSQAASSLTLQSKVSSPEFQMLKVWLEGLGPSLVAEKLKLVGL